jgi:hypothetical protein
MGNLKDILDLLRSAKETLTVTVPGGIDVGSAALRKVADAADEIAKYLRGLGTSPVFSVQDAAVHADLEALALACETEPVAKGVILDALVRAAIAALIRRLLAGNAPGK